MNRAYPSVSGTEFPSAAPPVPGVGPIRAPAVAGSALAAGRWCAFLLWLAGILAGCARHPLPARPGAVAALTSALGSLAPAVSGVDAENLAREAHARARELAEQYRVVRPALLHNYLVNTGARERGLCHEWAEDLHAHLRAWQGQSLELHWAVAREGTNREHNGLVVTARGQPFERGILLDAWRHGGSLFWSRVAEDRYPWVERR